MKGKTVVITGGTSGIGEIAAERLAQMGARIVLIARSKSRGKVTLARLHEKAPDLAHTVHYADLTRIPEMKCVAAEIASQEPRIDVLINNAGAMFANRRLTEDGLECTFALNHMAYFVITDGLRERLLASSPARIVNSASAAHQGARLDFDDLQLAKSFGPMKAYGRSKLCNILFTRELASRLHGAGVAPTHRTVANSARRQSCSVTLGAQRCLGRAKCLRACGIFHHTKTRLHPANSLTAIGS
jgi:NAD(P)-dependent dehydrogenase (short-subunit alcohol dehydrogenase family)